jgi:hypothetical protein
MLVAMLSEYFSVSLTIMVVGTTPEDERDLGVEGVG